MIKESILPNGSAKTIRQIGMCKKSSRILKKEKKVDVKELGHTVSVNKA